MDVWLVRRAMGPQTSVEGVFKSHAAAERWVKNNIKDYEKWIPAKKDKSKKTILWSSEYHGAMLRLEKWHVNK